LATRLEFVGLLYFRLIWLLSPPRRRRAATEVFPQECRLRKLSLLVLSLAAVALPRVAFGTPLAMVTNQSANAVHVFRTDNWTLPTVIPIGNGAAPSGIALPPTGTFALVANRGNGTVSRINLPPSSVSATFAVPGGPTSVAITPDGTHAYVVQSTN